MLIPAGAIDEPDAAVIDRSPSDDALARSPIEIGPDPDAATLGSVRLRVDPIPDGCTDTALEGAIVCEPVSEVLTIPDGATTDPLETTRVCAPSAEVLATPSIEIATAEGASDGLPTATVDPAPAGLIVALPLPFAVGEPAAALVPTPLTTMVTLPEAESVATPIEFEFVVPSKLTVTSPDPPRVGSPTPWVLATPIGVSVALPLAINE